MLEQIFKIRENGTTVGTEALAGLTTFLTMAYIIFVNPEILSATGMDRGAVFVATCLAAAAGSILMGCYANYPIALAPGMGLNAYFAYGVVQGMHVGWEAALGVIFISGILFFLVSVSPIRAMIVEAIPPSLKFGIAAGIGLLLAVVGLENAGIIVGDSTTLVALGDLHAPKPILAAFGFVLILGLAYRRVMGSLVIAIFAVAALGIPFGLTEFKGLASAPPPLAPTFLAMDIGTALDIGLAGVIFAFFFVTLFDNTGTLIGVAQRGGFLDAKGRLPRLRHALVADSTAAIAGAALGTSTTTRYIESVAGVEAGGRTGLTAVFVGLFFIAAIFLSPLAASIPGYATAPALVYVACLMAQSLRSVDWDDILEFAPALVTTITIPLTFSITDGIGFGFIVYAIGKLLGGRGREVHGMVWAIAIAFAVFIAAV